MEFHRKAGSVFEKVKNKYPKCYDAWKIDYCMLKEEAGEIKEAISGLLEMYDKYDKGDSESIFVCYILNALASCCFS